MTGTKETKRKRGQQQEHESKRTKNNTTTGSSTKTRSRTRNKEEELLGLEYITQEKRYRFHKARATRGNFCSERGKSRSREVEVV